MSEQHMATTVGMHTAQIDILLKEHREVREDIEQVKRDVHAIRMTVDSYVASVKGGWKVLIVIGVILVSFAQAVGWAAEKLGGIGK